MGWTRMHLWGWVSPLEASPDPHKESTEERGTEQGENSGGRVPPPVAAPELRNGGD